MMDIIKIGDQPMNTLNKLRMLQSETDVFTEQPPNPKLEPVDTILLASVGGNKERPGYYGHGVDGLVWVAPLNCPDLITLDAAKRNAGVMTVRAYLPME